MKITNILFCLQGGEGVNAGVGEVEWVVAKDRYKYDETFDKLNPIDGKITGTAAKQEMVKSKLPNNVLGKIWKLSDVDKVIQRILLRLIFCYL